MTACHLSSSLEIGDQLIQSIDIVFDGAEGPIACVTEPSSGMTMLMAMIKNYAVVIAAAGIANFRTLSTEGSFITRKVECGTAAVIAGPADFPQLFFDVFLLMVADALLSIDLIAMCGLIVASVGNNLLFVFCAPRLAVCSGAIFVGNVICLLVANPRGFVLKWHQPRSSAQDGVRDGSSGLNATAVPLVARSAG